MFAPEFRLSKFVKPDCFAPFSPTFLHYPLPLIAPSEPHWVYTLIKPYTLLASSDLSCTLGISVGWCLLYVVCA